MPAKRRERSHKRRKREAVSFGAPTIRRLDRIAIRRDSTPCAVRRRSTPALSDKLHESGRQWAGPFILAFHCQSRRVQSVSRQKQLAVELRSPSGLDEIQVKLFSRSVNFVAHDRMTNRCEMHSDLVGSSCVWNRSDSA